jgi:hypothetical protein
MFFALEHKLVSETEMKAIDNITAPYIAQYAQLSSGESKQ